MAAIDDQIAELQAKIMKARNSTYGKLTIPALTSQLAILNQQKTQAANDATINSGRTDAMTPPALPPGTPVVGTQPVDPTKYNLPAAPDPNPTYTPVNSNTGAPLVITSPNNQPPQTPQVSPVYEPPSAPKTITSDSGGIIYNPSSNSDQNKLLAEAELQKDLQTQTLGQQQSQRKQHLSDLADLLAKQDATAFDQARPDIYEDLNSRGLLRSSELGSRLATKQQELSKATNYALAQQALSDSATSTNALGGIEDQYISGRNSAIGREFSLADYSRQIAASKELGIAMQPMTPTQPSAKGGSALQGAAAGGTIGATTGGPAGAVAGTVLGAIAGGKLGSK